MPVEPPHKPVHAPLSRAVRAVTGVTLLSRVGGLVRDILIVRIFGNTATGSAFAAAFQIPNLFRRLFGEGALSAAFIPAYTAAEREGQDQADRLATLTLCVLGAVTVGLAALIALALLLVLWLLPGDPERDLSLTLIIVMIPFMPLICIAAIMAGMLQVHGRFGPASSGPLILNAFIIAVGVWCLATGRLADASVAYILGAATVLSGLTQVLWFRRLLRPHAPWRRDWRPIMPAARAMLRKFVPVAIGLGTLQLNTLLDTLIAMYPIWFAPTLMGFAYPLDDASNIILSQTARLYQFPLGVFGIAVATAVFPLLARQAPTAAAGLHDHGAFVGTLRRGLRLSLFIGLPATVGLILVRYDITSVLFGRVGGGDAGGAGGAGQAGFDEQGVIRAAAVLLGFAPGVWAYGLNHVFTRAFYALGDTRTPMRVAIGAMILNLALNAALIWPLAEAGLAWATSASAMVQTLVLWRLLQRRLGAGRSAHVILNRETLWAMARIVVGCGFMGVAVATTIMLVDGQRGWWWELCRLAAATVVGGASYVIACKPLRVNDLRHLLGRDDGPDV